MHTDFSSSSEPSHISISNIIPFFQSIIDLDNFGVCRYECLARLIDQSMTTYKPESFMQFIEREAYTANLSEHMLMQCVHAFEHQNMPWNINITASECLQPYLCEHLTSALPYVPNFGHVGLELSQQDALSIMPHLPEFIDRCRRLNVGVYIDNVTDMTVAAQRLFSLDLAGFKLSERIVNQANEDNQIADYIGLMTQHANANNMQVIAELVEQENTLFTLRGLGIRYAQGYLLGKPKQTLTSIFEH